jgi:hypothetical protein
MSRDIVVTVSEHQVANVRGFVQQNFEFVSNITKLQLIQNTNVLLENILPQFWAQITFSSELQSLPFHWTSNGR